MFVLLWTFIYLKFTFLEILRKQKKHIVPIMSIFTEFANFIPYLWTRIQHIQRHYLPFRVIHPLLFTIRLFLKI